MWEARDKSLELLKGELSTKNAMLEEAFSILDECIDLFEKKAHDDVFHRMCGVTLLKAKNLAIGCYSLILDGLGQEAGALLRPLIEYQELLVYFRDDPSRVEQALNDSLPNPGTRAKLIEGNFQKFRNHLNEHASHSAYSSHSLGHLLTDSGGFKKLQRTSLQVLDKNISDLFAHVLLLAQEANNTLQTAEYGYSDKPANDILDLKERARKVFDWDTKLSSDE